MRWMCGLLAVLSLSQFRCEQTVAKNDPTRDRAASTCAKTGVVRDLGGLDGCGMALELADGSKLVPQRLVYIQAPDSAQDPAYYFEFKAGQEVCFDYRETDDLDACMAGKLVFLTCIKVCE